MVQRRTILIAGLASSFAGVPLAWSATSAFTLQDFVALSAKLTQRAGNTLDARAAQALFDALSVQPGLAALAQLATSPANEAAATAEGRDVIRAWYTGVVNTPEGPQRVAGAAPLVWSSAPFLHPPATCGGATGYWAQSPQT